MNYTLTIVDITYRNIKKIRLLQFLLYKQKKGSENGVLFSISQKDYYRVIIVIITLLLCCCLLLLGCCINCDFPDGVFSNVRTCLSWVHDMEGN